MKPFKKALVYEFEGDTGLSEMAKEYAEEVTIITATDDYQGILKAEHLQGVDFFLVGVFDDFKNDYYDLKTLKLVCIDWTRTDMFDLNFLMNNDIAFINTKGQATEGVAQLTFNMMLNLLRNTPEAMTYAKADGPSFVDFKGFEIASRKIAIRGLGDIGLRFAEICTFFSAQITYSSRSKKALPYEYVELEDLTNGVDVLVITTDLTDETKNSINKLHLEKLNKNAVILTPGLFETFVADELYDFLVDRPDVKFWSDVNQSAEWKVCKEKFLALPNFYATPHTGFFTHENRPRTLKLVHENIEQYISVS